MRMKMNAARTLLASILATALLGTARAAEKPPGVGDHAKDFELQSLGGKTEKLSKLTDAGPVVLVVLRGWPGYQCPLGTRQVRDRPGHRA